MNTPWAILLVKFSDGDAEPYARERYEEIFTTAGSGPRPSRAPLPTSGMITKSCQEPVLWRDPGLANDNFASPERLAT
jgi:hypothetical protein